MIAASKGRFDDDLYRRLCDAANDVEGNAPTAAQFGLFWHLYWEFTKTAGIRTFWMRLAAIGDSVKGCLGFGDQSQGPLDATRILAVSATEVSLSMRYAAQGGMEIDKSLFESLLASCVIVQNKDATQSNIAEFWSLYNKFNKLLAPASITSASKTLRVLESAFVGPFIVITVIAIIVFTGTGLLLIRYSDGSAMKTNLDVASKDFAAADADWLSFVTPNTGPTPELGKEAQSAAAAQAILRSVPASAAAGNGVNDVHVAPTNLTAACTARVVAANRIISSGDALMAWLGDKEDLKKNFKLATAATKPETCGHDAAPIVSAANGLITRVSLALARLATVELPILLGLLGAAIFMLRSVINQIKDGTYSAVFYSQTLVRLCLGSFAGFSTALLFSPDALPTALKGLSTSGIAFAAGYSIDIVFAFLDKIVSAFSSERK